MCPNSKNDLPNSYKMTLAELQRLKNELNLTINEKHNNYPAKDLVLSLYDIYDLSLGNIEMAKKKLFEKLSDYFGGFNDNQKVVIENFIRQFIVVKKERG